MEYNNQDYKYQEITSKIIKAFYNVYNTLGYGFLEKVYENALMIELRKLRLEAIAQVPIKVYYNNETVGDYFADVIVNKVVIIEIKAMEALREEHEAQLLNYLRATDIEIGLLVNFGKKPEFRRKVWTNKQNSDLANSYLPKSW